VASALKLLQKYKPTSALPRGGSTPAPAKSSEFLIISPYDSRK
jgi:hypothetical protein